MPLKHPFIMLVLRVPEIEIPLSALCTSFCQQASKEKKRHGWAACSMKKISHQHLIDILYMPSVFPAQTFKVWGYRADEGLGVLQQSSPVSSHGADQSCFGVGLMNFQKFTTFPISYHMVLNPIHIARDVVRFGLGEVGDTYSILWTQIPAALGLWIVLFSGIWPVKWLICAK